MTQTQRAADQIALMTAELDKRNEATKVWIQSDTQARARCNELEAQLAATVAERDRLSAQVERLLRELDDASQAGTPYWKERDMQNALVMEATRLRAQVELLHDTILWSGSNDWTPPAADGWARIIAVVRQQRDLTRPEREGL